MTHGHLHLIAFLNVAALTTMNLPYASLDGSGHTLFNPLSFEGNPPVDQTGLCGGLAVGLEDVNDGEGVHVPWMLAND